MKALSIFFLALAIHLTGAARQEEPIKVIKQVNPHYPAIVKAAGIEGMVWIKVGVDASGEVETVDVVRATDTVFIRPTLDAVEQWKFAPATIDGKPVKAQVTIPFKYTLDPGSYKSGYKDDMAESEHVAMQILRGKFSPELRSRVDDSATVATPGARKMNLLKLLDNPQSAKRLVEGESLVIESTRAIPVVDGAMCYLLTTKPAKGERPLHHSVVFVQKSGMWKITDWQVWE